MLRYLDFDVEPGKQYAYRVFVLLRNPNYALPDNVLDQPNENKAKYLHLVQSGPADANGKVVGWHPKDENYWSGICQSSKLPGDMRLLAGPAEPPKLPSPLEITGESRVFRWDLTSGLNSYGTVSGLFRGAILNFTDLPMKVPGVEGREKVAHVDTNCVLVDLGGGEWLTPRDRDKTHGPGMMLVLDEAGNLVFHEEMSETAEWTAETKEPDRANSIVPSGRFPGRFEGPPRRVRQGQEMLPDNFPGGRQPNRGGR